MPRAIINARGGFVDFVHRHEIEEGMVRALDPGWELIDVPWDHPIAPMDRWRDFRDELENEGDLPPGEVRLVQGPLENLAIPVDDVEDNPIANHLRDLAAANGEPGRIMPDPRGFAHRGLGMAARAGFQRKERTVNGPDLWKFVLGNVQEIYGCEACVAGGAVRDFLLDLPVKDIDIFIDHNFPEIVLESMRELNFGEGTNLSDRKYQQHDKEIKGVWEFYDVKGHVINLIMRPIPKEDYVRNVLNTFDFNICKSAFSIHPERGPEMYDDPLAAVDRHSSTFTYSGPEDNEAKLRSEKRFKSFADRHPKVPFKLAIPGLDKIKPEKKAKSDKDPWLTVTTATAWQPMFNPVGQRVGVAVRDEF